MQAISVFIPAPAYTPAMAAGRPAKSERSPFGERLVTARQQLGLSQIQVAEKVGITQQTYAGWERRTTALRPENITQLAGALNVSVDYLLGQENERRHGGGPVGKARQIFEEVSHLPRHQQQRIISVVQDMLAAHRLSKQSV
jgi:transcriptional regulator with XRE-family HTH domain